MGINGYAKVEAPPHTVILHDYYIDQFEVNNATFAEFLNAQGNQFEGLANWIEAKDVDLHVRQVDGVWKVDPGFENYPMNEMTWYGARAYCTWRGGRLPSEAEWEKAARGTDERIYPWGEGISCDLANYAGCVRAATPVDSYPAGISPYGVYNMAGNMMEWTNDSYDPTHPDYYANAPLENPTGPTTGSFRVIRGGSWINNTGQVMTIWRFPKLPVLTFTSVGFRCVKDVEATSQAAVVATTTPQLTSAASETLAPTLPPATAGNETLTPTLESMVTPTMEPTPTALISSLSAVITDTHGIPMALIPAGEFTMGSDTNQIAARPAHKVYLDNYYLDIYEVTNERFLECVEAGVCSGGGRTLRSSVWVGHPVLDVTWFQAVEYCEWRGARLPTEAEWEKAARGTDERLFPWGNQPVTCELARYGDCGWMTVSVGSHPLGVSPYGIYDMAGNAWEWTNDWYSMDYYKISPYENPQGPEQSTGWRSTRGGAWFYQAPLMTAVWRNQMAPSHHYQYIGFRCALTP